MKLKNESVTLFKMYDLLLPNIGCRTYYSVKIFSDIFAIDQYQSWILISNIDNMLICAKIPELISYTKYIKEILYRK